MRDAYLLANQRSELGRLQLQSRIWEPAARGLLRRIEPPPAPRAVDVGCGALGWLRVLAEWAGPTGTVVGTDIDGRMLSAAASFLRGERITRATAVHDDIFASALPAHTFDLVHARFQLATIGRVEEQLAGLLRLVRPGGWLVLEEPDTASWHLNPPAPAVERLIELVIGGFAAGGGDLDAGRSLPAYLRRSGIEPVVDAHVLALPAGHPYLRLPLQFATSLAPQLRPPLVAEEELRDVMQRAEDEMRGDRWGTTFTLIQAWGRWRGPE